MNFLKLGILTFSLLLVFSKISIAAQEVSYVNFGILSGEVSGSVTAKQLPTVRSYLISIKAENGNAGDVYLGISGVTVADGTTDTTTGLELSAGETTGWIPASNLNLFYIICDNAGDDITYMVIN